jgi:hypothetical protein
MSVSSANVDPFLFVPPVLPGEPLLAAEHDIFNRLAAQKAEGPFALFMNAARTQFVTEEIGHDAAVDPRHKKLLDFFEELIITVDRAYDTRRSSFASSVQGGMESFGAALRKLTITHAGTPHFTAVEAGTILTKKLDDPTLYAPPVASTLRDSIATFSTRAVEAARLDSSTLNGQESRTVKEVTNGLYAGLQFDLLYGVYSGLKGYARARNRFVASQIAFQYHDDVGDVVADRIEGSANVVLGYAIDHGEEADLHAAQDGLVALLPDEDGRYDPSAFSFYCQALGEVAPKSYESVVRDQDHFLGTAALRPLWADAIRLRQ